MASVSIPGQHNYLLTNIPHPSKKEYGLNKIEFYFSPSGN